MPRSPAPSFVELILDRAVREPDALIVADRERRFTCAQFAQLVYRLARALDDAGVKRGDLVAILAPISPEALAVSCAAALTGCVTMFCPNKRTGEGLRTLLAQIPADALIVFPGTVTAAAAAIAGGSLGRVMSLGAVPGIEADLLAVSETMAAAPLESGASDGDLGVLVSSGATTGASKASRRSFAAYGRMVDAAPTRDRRQLVCTPLAYVAQVLAERRRRSPGIRP